MKQNNSFFRTLCVLFISLLGVTTVQANKDLRLEYFDSVEVSLLTCSPHEEIYSLYGHSALRWHNLHTAGRVPGEDIAYNWGIFNFNEPFFVLRFVFGLTDYELGAIPYTHFCDYYAHWGSSVTEQVLNLTNEEKAKLGQALWENMQPRNRVYRYNYFYDNCSTRPRNMIESCISGKVEYAKREDYTPSYREMVRTCARNHPWAKFGNDMLLGVRADLKANLREQEFLPENLMYDFGHARIYADGSYRPLVKEQRIAVAPGVQVVKEDFPLTPTQCAWVVLVLSVVVLCAEWRRKKTFRWFDIGWMLLQGATGIVLVLMFFSQHPTTSTNLQVLLLNPLPLFFIPAVWRRDRRTRYWWVLLAMTVLFLAGGLVQHYAEGMHILALCLLTRVYSNIRHEK